MIKRLRLKVNSYNAQDERAGRLYYSEKYNGFNVKPLELSQVLKMIQKNGLSCHYCKKNTRIIPNYHKDPVQFTLDRIDNNKTHTISNCIVSCWMCNEGRSNSYTSCIFEQMMREARS